MSNYQLTPKELGEMEIQELVFNAIQSRISNFSDHIALRILGKINYAVTLTKEHDMQELISLLLKVIGMNWSRFMYPAQGEYQKDPKGYAKEITNQLIACEFITEQTLEELGQKQLNEAY